MSVDEPHPTPPTPDSVSVDQEIREGLEALIANLTTSIGALRFLAATLDDTPRQGRREAVRLPTAIAHIAGQTADHMATLAQRHPHKLSIHELADLRGVSVNTLRQRLPGVPTRPATGASDEPPF